MFLRRLTAGICFAAFGGSGAGTLCNMPLKWFEVWYKIILGGIDNIEIM
jgi:hypothetical protein